MKHVQLFEQFLNEGSRTSAKTQHIDLNHKIEHEPGVDYVQGYAFEVRAKNHFTKGSYLRITVIGSHDAAKGMPLVNWMLSETSESLIELIENGNVIGTVKIDRDNYKATAKKMWKLSSHYETQNWINEKLFADVLKLWIDMTDEFPVK